MNETRKKRGRPATPLIQRFLQKVEIEGVEDPLHLQNLAHVSISQWPDHICTTRWSWKGAVVTPQTPNTFLRRDPKNPENISFQTRLHKPHGVIYHQGRRIPAQRAGYIAFFGDIPPGKALFWFRHPLVPPDYLDVNPAKWELRNKAEPHQRLSEVLSQGEGAAVPETGTPEPQYHWNEEDEIQELAEFLVTKFSIRPFHNLDELKAHHPLVFEDYSEDEILQAIQQSDIADKWS